MGNPDTGSRQNNERNGGISRLRTFLGSLTAAGILAVSGCAEASEAKKPDSDTKAENTWVLASADEAKAFASLSADVQKHIRAEFNECMADVEEFANEEPNEKIMQIAFESGADDCDSIRNSQIRTAVAQKSIEETTKSITSG